MAFYRCPAIWGLRWRRQAHDYIAASFIHDSFYILSDYDLILTGDLSHAGFSFFAGSCLRKEDSRNSQILNDCGLLIYDRKQAAGFLWREAGAHASMRATIAYVFERLRKKELNRVLVLATGALLSPIATFQKQSIPCIAHAIEYQKAGKFDGLSSCICLLWQHLFDSTAFI